jgi:hypothetical protein
VRLVDAGGHSRVSAGACGAALLFIVYCFTLAPDVTFWDAGEFIAAAHSLGIPHPPGTPLFVLLAHVWAKLLFFLSYPVATNLLSAVATSAAAFISARLVQRATDSGPMALAAALIAGTMSSVWLNATETEVYAASLLLGILVVWAGERAGRAQHGSWLLLTAYLMVLAVPLHLSALVAAPAAIALASYSGTEVHWRRAALLAGSLVLAMGVGRMSWWLVAAGAIAMVAARPRTGAAMLGVSLIAASALAFLYVRARFDPAINQGNPDTLASLIEMVARRQYAVSPMLPRSAPLWVQFGNLGQYADWQAALSLGPTVLPSIARTAFTVLFLVLGYHGAVAHWRADRRTWVGVAALFLCGTLGVLVYLNLHAGPSIAYGMLPANAVREARERDYFFVFGFWAWGLWAGIGAVTVARSLSRPAWTGVLVAALPVILNWRAVTRHREPEQSLPMALASAFLESTPRNGVLFVMGDNDSYPLWFAQQVRGVRPDVAVITVPLLPTRWYREQIGERFGLLDAEEIGRFPGRLETAAVIADGARARGRPIAVSMTMTPSERQKLGQRWTASALVYVEGDQPVDRVQSGRLARWVERELGSKPTRPAVDPVSAYFRRMLDCPRQLESLAVEADSTRLDSACNYR